jgi:hypothetical protein
VVLLLALLLPLSHLADITARLTLAVFALVNLSLVRIKARDAAPPSGFVAPGWMPWAGFLTCLVLIVLDLVLKI